MRSPGYSRLAALALVTASAFLIAACSEAPTVPDDPAAQLHHAPGHDKGGGPPGGGDDGGDEGPAYDVVTLETPAGYTSSQAGALAENGGGIVVVGTSSDSDGAFSAPTKWTVTVDEEITVTETSVMDVLDETYGDLPLAVHTTGVSVGFTGGLAPRWDADGSVMALETGDGWEGTAHDIATVGGAEIIVGTRRFSEDGALVAVEAVYWTNGADGSAPVTLPPLAEGARAGAYAVNSDGTIAGFSPGGNVVIWHRVAGAYQICDLGTSGIATAISESSGGRVYVAGASDASDWHATVWTVDPVDCIVDIDRRLDIYSEFHDVNAQGDAVGEDLRKHRAILSTADQQLVELPNEGKGRTAAAAHAIDGDGSLIAGWRSSKSGGGAVLWSRLP